MKYIYVGKIVNTHGIKGEIRILSDFLKKDLVFKKNFILYIGPSKEKEIIKTYRKHKEFDMVTLEGINNINEVLKYKGCNVYINREDLKIADNNYILEDLIDFEIKENEKTLGKLKDFMYNNGNILLIIEGQKKFYIPYNDYYIKKVDLKNKIVYTENAKDLIL